MVKKDHRNITISLTQKFNTELMLVYGKKGPEKFYYKFNSKFNTELMLVYGQ